MALWLAHIGTRLALASTVVAAPATLAACESTGDGENDGENDDDGSGPESDGLSGSCPSSLAIAKHNGQSFAPCADATEETCADHDNFCECQPGGIDTASAWACVPTLDACPDATPGEGDACDASVPICHYVVDAERIRCRCEAPGQWDCSPSTICGIYGPDQNISCPGFEGETCDFLQIAGGKATVIGCTCVDQAWSCAPTGT